MLKLLFYWVLCFFLPPFIHAAKIRSKAKTCQSDKNNMTVCWVIFPHIFLIFLHKIFLKGISLINSKFLFPLNISFSLHVSWRCSIRLHRQIVLSTTLGQCNFHPHGRLLTVNKFLPRKVCRIFPLSSDYLWLQTFSRLNNNLYPFLQVRSKSI